MADQEYAGGRGLIKYMSQTWKEPMLIIATPSDPFDFREPVNQEYHAFNYGDNIVQDFVAAFMQLCQQRRAHGHHTVLVVFWYANNETPIIKERIVSDESVWALAHDTEFLNLIGDRLRMGGDNYVDRYRTSGKKGEWVTRGAIDDIRASCVLMRNVGVKRMVGFGRISHALKNALPTV